MPPFTPGKAAVNPAAPVDVHTPGEYTSTKEFRMDSTAQTTKTTTLAIDGMSCGHCVQAVTKALSGVPGVTVKSVAVGLAVIETADGWTMGKAVAALEESGYPAKAMGDSAGSAAPMPAKGGGSCCGGAKAATTNGQPGAKNSGGCCG
jgi:copper chaperone CopZ